MKKRHILTELDKYIKIHEERHKSMKEKAEHYKKNGFLETGDFYSGRAYETLSTVRLLQFFRITLLTEVEE